MIRKLLVMALLFVCCSLQLFAREEINFNDILVKKSVSVDDISYYCMRVECKTTVGKNEETRFYYSKIFALRNTRPATQKDIDDNVYVTKNGQKIVSFHPADIKEAAIEAFNKKIVDANPSLNINYYSNSVTMVKKDTYKEVEDERKEMMENDKGFNAKIIEFSFE